MGDQNYRYAQIYRYMQRLIEEGSLKPGDRLPSVLACTREMGVSKSTVENAYYQLAADGYIISRERSGYYVTHRAGARGNETDSGESRGKGGADAFRLPESIISGGMSDQSRKVGANSGGTGDSVSKAGNAENTIYDLASVGDDPEGFRFDLWQRYLKSAIRHRDRMAAYGEPQGEPELREAICEYVRKRRSIYCSPDNIVIGASTQSLLMLLLPLLKERGARTASVPARGFERYAQVFRSYDLRVDIRRKEANILYVSPSHMTVWGDVMSRTRRYEILEHSKKGHFIIEDDYQSEFIYSKKVTPSLYAMAEGQRVVYMGSFSRILLPSIRISFMILPRELVGAYREVASLYDQTASKTEQLALQAYLRDDHLYRQIRKLHRIYGGKRELLREILETLTADLPGLSILSGDGGTEMAVRGEEESLRPLRQRLAERGIACREIRDRTETSAATTGRHSGRAEASVRQGSRGLTAASAGEEETARSILIFSCGISETARLQELLEKLREQKGHIE